MSIAKPVPLSAAETATAPAEPGAARRPAGGWRKHSTLLALLGLLVAFELLGRLFSSELRAAYLAALGGDGTWSDAMSQALASLGASDLAFLNPRNLTNLAVQTTLTGVLAVGMTLVILTGGIDLSVGSVVALSGVVIGLVDRAFVGVGAAGIAIASGIGAGMAVGAVSGLLIARFKITPFVITLGMLVIARGLALILSNSSAIAPLSDPIRFAGGGFLPGWIGAAALAVAVAVSAAPALARRRELPWQALPAILAGSCLALVFWQDRGVPAPTMILAAVAVCGIFLSRRTVFGRSLYAIGGNETAAVLSGLAVPRVKFAVYTLMGALAGIAGLILAGRLNSATPTEGNLLELDAIASAVIGGASLQGGVGLVQGSIIGALIIGALNNGMDMLEIDSNWQMVTKGLIIIFAVYSDARLRRAG